MSFALPRSCDLSKQNDRNELAQFTRQCGARTQQSGDTTRITDYRRDENQRPVIITRPDNKVEYRFYDGMNRLAYSVSALGLLRNMRMTRNTANNKLRNYARD